MQETVSKELRMAYQGPWASEVRARLAQSVPQEAKPEQPQPGEQEQKTSEPEGPERQGPQPETCRQPEPEEAGAERPQRSWSKQGQGHRKRSQRSKSKQGPGPQLSRWGGWRVRGHMDRPATLARSQRTRAATQQ